MIDHLITIFGTLVGMFPLVLIVVYLVARPRKKGCPLCGGALTIFQPESTIVCETCDVIWAVPYRFVHRKSKYRHLDPRDCATD